MRITLLLILLFLASVFRTSAQSRNSHDTSYVQSYNDRIVVGLFQSYRELQYNLQETMVGDTSYPSNAVFVAPSRHATGISFSYDKISVSLAATTPATELEKKRFGATNFFSLGLSITSGKHRIESFYRKISGFYDKNTELRSDAKWSPTDSIYFQRPNMTTWVVKVRGFRFFNQKKFSYGSAYVNNYRQIKSAGSFFLMGDLYYNEIRTSDFYLHRKLTPMWKQYGDLNFMNFYGASAGFGYSFNLVLWRTLYVNLLADLGMNLQHREFKTLGHTVGKSDWKFGLAQSDLRGAMGINGRSFFWSVSIQYDNTVYKWADFKLNSLQVSTFANIGYRFKVKDRKWNTWLRNNKIYQFF
ncbi:MAG: DUF4421 family protein [Flavobacteriales bacterium]